MTHTKRAANAAAETALDLVIEFPVDAPALALVIREELQRQERAFLDHLNDTAPVPAIGPETECPV